MELVERLGTTVAYIAYIAYTAYHELPGRDATSEEPEAGERDSELNPASVAGLDFNASLPDRISGHGSYSYTLYCSQRIRYIGIILIATNQPACSE